MDELDEFYDRLAQEGHLPSTRTYEVVVGGFGGVPLETMHMAHAVLLPVGNGTYKVMKTRYGTERDVIVPARIMHALFGTPMPEPKVVFEPEITESKGEPIFYRYRLTAAMRVYLGDLGVSVDSFSRWHGTWEVCHKAAVALQAAAIAYEEKRQL